MSARTQPGWAWLHGYTMSSRIWPEVWAHLPGRRHIGLDLPGHGTSLDDPWPDDLVGLAHRVADQLERAECRTLIGLSFGSSVALQVAQSRPEAIDALVLAAPTLGGPVDDPTARAKYLLLSRVHAVAGQGPALTELWMADPPGIFTTLRAHPEAYARMREVVGRHAFGELRTGAMRAITDTVQDAADLAGITTPTLVVVGAQDMPRFLAVADLMDRVMPNSTVRTVPDAGHLPLLERPAECAALIERFAATTDQPYASAGADTAGPASTARSSSREWTPNRR